MRARSYIFLVIWACCYILDRLGFTATDDPAVRYSFVGAIIGAVGSIASGVAGSIAANKRRRDAEQVLSNRKKQLQTWRDSEMGTNFLDRADSRAMLRRVTEHNKEAMKGMETSAIKQGMTDEAKVAQAAKLNENYGDVVSQIAAAGARHKDRVQQQYMGETRNLDNLKIQNLMDSSGIDDMVQGMTGAAAGLGTALAGIGGTGRSGGNVGYSGVRSAAAGAVGIPKNYKINL